LGLWYFLRTKQLSFKLLGLIKPRWADVGYTLLAFGAYFLVYGILLSLATTLVPSLDLNQKQELGFDAQQNLAGLIMVFLALVVLAPLTEEVLFRGFILQGLRSRWAFLPSALLTSVVFGTAHLMGGSQGAALLWVAGLDTLVLSMVLCYLREKTGGLWAGIGLHALKNSIAFVALFVLHAQ